MFTRTLVAVKCYGENSYSVAKFAECLVCLFERSNSQRDVATAVQCKLEENLLKLTPATQNLQSSNLSNIQWDEKMGKFADSQETGSDFVLLHHSPECPIANMTDDDMKSIPADIQLRGIDVAVSILVESKDSRILMTKRPEHMRTFPRAWVPPGGHIEQNESLVDAGLRELKEETGLVLAKDTIIDVLCLWESVYPVLLGLGTPVRHHVVVYLLARVNSTSSELFSSLQLDPEEVQACAWLTPDAVKFLLTGAAAYTGIPEPPQNMLAMDSKGKLTESPLNLKTMFHPSLWGRGNQIYSGSQLALSSWYNLLNSRSNAKL